ncbi:FixH family protein [Lewinella cohaerens]|uniref:FixH family protein n=1 Tax=Lewinella cohaerens TaxID=70995 RepID=UPI00035F6B87|nr:FixH family protein [Lewinella cohaerens]
MKIEFNWGTGIFVFYVLFASVLFFSVYESTKVDHSLVVENYYEEDLAYQNQYNRLENSAKLKEPLRMKWQSDGRKLVLAFPTDLATSATGQIAFYRPDDKSMDWQLPIAVDQAGQMEVQMAKLPVGRWKVKVYWEAADTPYFAEKIIDLR